MLVSDIIAFAQRRAGLLGVGQTALAQDTADAQTQLLLMLQQWRQQRWLVFRLDNVLFPLTVGKPDYTVGPATASPAPDVVVTGNYRPANIQSCFLRQEVGSGPNSYPIDFPMRVLESREQWDQISLKSLLSWPSLIYYDPTVGVGNLMIWPIPMQNLFSLYIGFQQAIDMAGEAGASVDFDAYLPVETQQAIVDGLAVQLCISYSVPVNPALAAAQQASMNVLRKANFAIQPLRMPSGLRGRVRMKNPAAGFYPELSTTVPYSVLS